MGYRDYSTAKGHIVDTTGHGDFTTIQSAITAASSGQTIFIRPGTYTENPTLKAGVNLVAYDADSFTPNVIISGKCTFTAAGRVSLCGIRLQTNSDFALAVTGASASIVNLIECYINCINNTGISFSSSSSSSSIFVFDSDGDVGTTGISLFSMSSPGTLELFNCNVTKTGGSTTASTVSAGLFGSNYSVLGIPISTSGTGAIASSYNSYLTDITNTTCFTVAGSGGAVSRYDTFSSGTASALSITTIMDIFTANIDSSNTNAIAGAGTLSYSNLTFTNTSVKNNVTTQTGGVAQGSVTNAPSAGFLGEQIRSAVSSVSLTNGTAVNVTSINVTAGVWDITGVCSFSGGGTNTFNQLSVNTTSATLGTDGDNLVWGPTIVTGVTEASACIPAWRQVFTTTTTVYLVAKSAFTVSMIANARISAVRVA